MKIQRRAFTLIEMVVVITILILFSSVVGINIAAAFRQQKFDAEVDAVVDRLRLAQNLMLVMNRDVDVIVEVKGEEGIEIRLEVEGGLPSQWAPTMKNARYLLTAIHLFEFEDPAAPPGSSQIDIRFYSGGSVMSRGVVRLSTHEEKNNPSSLTKAICLKGYPHPIVAMSEKEKRVECPEERTEYDERLTFYTVEELKNNATP